MKRKQRADETVDNYSQDFESLFEKSYGKRLGMDVASRELLKRDLFVQGLLMKWQEKVLQSANSFDDALHQARAAEEQKKQLLEIHDTTAPQKPYYKRRVLAKLNHKVATKEPHLMDLLEIKAESLEHVTSVGAKITYIVSVLNGNLL